MNPDLFADAVSQRKPRPGWFFTPRWHWRYWIGQRMRQETYTVPRGASFAGLSWRYRTFGQHARAILEEQATHGQDRAYTAELPFTRFFNNGG